jgi:hypothetical protein
MECEREGDVRIVNIKTTELRGLVKSYFKHIFKEELPKGWVLSIFKDSSYVIEIREIEKKTMQA